MMKTILAWLAHGIPLVLAAATGLAQVAPAEKATPPARPETQTRSPQSAPGTDALTQDVPGANKTKFGPELYDLTLFSDRHTNNVTLTPGPDDRNIARVVTRLLENQHYRQKTIDDEISGKFLDRYLDTLDPMHMYFLQSDLSEFETYRSSLDDLTKDGKTTPANIIFNRFLERFRAQGTYVVEQLKENQFDFTGNDLYSLNRKNLPRPKDMAEAKQLWRERVRYEYLQEKLNQAQGDAVARIIREKLADGKRDDLPKALSQKLGKERIEELLKFIDERKAEPAEKIAEAVIAKMEREKHQEIVKIIVRRYSRLSRMLHEYDNDEVLQMYLTALAHVYDPHSDYMGRATLENFAIGMKLSLFGIGALLQSEDGYCKIKELTPGGPAIQSKKLKPGDRIIAVAQADNEAVDVVDMKLSKVVEMIRGPKGTVVKLTVIPVDAADPSIRKNITLVRDEIKLEDQEAKARLIDLPGKSRVGVIDLPSFYAEFVVGGRVRGKEQKSTTTDVRRLLKKLKEEQVEGVILDLRRNGGGSLEEAINLTGLFIPEGPVVQVRDPDGRIMEDRDEDEGVFYDGPLIVLTSRMSASASEILAGALQDYGRAVIVGDSATHGKGTVQSLMELKPLMDRFNIVSSNNPGALKLTIRKFYRANGASTQLKGVVPDLVLPSINNHAEVGEASLDNPLPWDTVPSAKYQRMNLVQPVMAELKKRSETRLATDRDYVYLREEIERYRKLIADKSVSLNEAQRVKEKKEAESRAEARKVELKARGKSPEKVYEITLKNAEMPGLPPVMAPTNSVATTEAVIGDPDNDEETAVDDSLPAMDITLDEAKRILYDLIALTANPAVAAKSKATVIKE